MMVLVCEAGWPRAGPCLGVMRDPGRMAGAQETALQPMAWPVKMSASHWPSSKNAL